ncbi:MAG: PilZ domain-containing protein [Candidatus Omnitrophota bacterium]
MENKRKFARLDINVDVHWKKIAQAEGVADTTSDSTKNLSRQGICLVTYQPLNIGEHLTLDIVLAPDRKIASKGKVNWIHELGNLGRKEQKKYEVGIEFLDISDRDQDEIRRFEVNPYVYKV